MTELTREMLDDFVKSGRFVVVHFWAPWNGYDFVMKNILATQLPQALNHKLIIGAFKIDDAEHNDLYMQYNIRNLPFLAFYRDAALVDTMTGMGKPEELLQRLARLVGKASAEGATT